MASVKIILRTSKVLANGEHPITIRITKDRKSKFVFTGKSSLKDHWDEKANLPNRKHPLCKELTVYLKKKLLDAETELLNLEKENKEYTAENIKETVKRQRVKKDVMAFLTEIIDENIKAGKVGNSSVYSDCKRALNRFLNGKPQLLFSEIDLPFLRKFENYLISKNVKESSISVYMRTLRAAFNRAIQDKLVKKDIYPFDDYKISKLNVQPSHRALDETKLKQIIAYQPEADSIIVHSHNYFVFSYYCWGINLTDIGTLKWKNVKNERLIYSRAKTGRLYNIPLLDPAVKILNFYKEYQSNTTEEDYVFPILNSEIHKTPTQIKHRIQKVNKRTNKDLQAIAEKLGIEDKITTYVARHSFATNLRNREVSTAKIQHMLGHASERTTQVYLDSFKNNELDEAAKLLL
ncbi:MAG TPA: site-specific integrase [Bacteroidia bacterium]|nr:site-specific integrase [Bacteroidia bacterium]